jgi:hypothetical protein
MDGYQGAYYKRKLNTVHYIKTKQGFMAHLICSQKKETNIIPNERSIGHDGCAYCNSPISQLIPREKISCVTQSEGKDEKENSNHPVELSGRPIRTRVEHPNHMKEDGNNHPMSSPSM